MFKGLLILANILVKLYSVNVCLPEPQLLLLLLPCQHNLTWRQQYCATLTLFQW